MLYYWLKYMMRFALAIYYRKRVFTGFDNVPATGPVIFACNHPNSFLDAMIVGAYLERETHSLARSDVFNSPLKLWILSQFKMMPIYRLSEGKEDLGKNKETFEKCHAVFRKGGAVLMFSEGICVQEMRLRSLKKGTARIAMEYSKDGAPLTIIPTGLNYLKPTQFREDILIQMDTPFNAADFAAEYNENASKGIQSFNKRLLEGLQNSVIDIKDKKNEKAYEQLVEIEYNNGATLNRLIDVVKPSYDEQTLASLADYRSTLEKEKLFDETVAGRRTSMLLAMPATLFFGLTFWLYVIPIAPAFSIRNNKIKLVEFKDSVLIGAAVVFTFLFWVIVFAIVTATTNVLFGLASILLFVFAASVARYCFDVMKTAANQNVYKNVPIKDSLESQRRELSSVFDLVKSHQSNHPVG